METAWLQRDDNGACFRHMDVWCRHLSVLQTQVIWKVLLVWHSYLSWIDCVCALSWLESGGASWPHLATHTVWPAPPTPVFSSSRLSCGSPDLILLPCVYEWETKRRLEGRRHHLAVIIPLMTDIRCDVGFLVCLFREKQTFFINKNHQWRIKLT